MSENTLQNSILGEEWTKTPDMGDYLDNDDIQRLANSIAEGEDGGAYFIESPFSTELGYHEAENVFVVSAKPVIVKDADTVAFAYNDINDGGKSFVFPSDNKTYDNVKNFFYNTAELSSSVDKLNVRLLGLNAPEIPHCRITYVNEGYKLVYAKFTDLMDNNTSVTLWNHSDGQSRYKVVDKNKIAFIRYKYTANVSEENEIDIEYEGPRTDADYYVKLLITNTSEKGEIYYEVVKANTDKVKGNNVDLPTLGICFGYSPSTGNENNQAYFEDGTKGRDVLKELASKASAIVFVLDGSTFKQQKDSIPLEYRGDAIRMSDDPAYAFQFFYNQITNQKKSYTRVGYNYFGQDYNRRALGAMYIKLSDYTDASTGKSYGEVWINAAKYILFKFKQDNTFEVLPSYSSSPANETAFNYNSGAFKMWSYDPDAQIYIDTFNGFHSEYGGDDRGTIQKELTGSDLSQLKEYTVLIGDCLLMVPPTSIRMVSQTNSQRTSLIRAKGAITKSIPKVERIIEMQLYFNGAAGINGIPYDQQTPSGETMKYYMNGLRSLIAQFKFCPYLPIDNKYINQVLNIEAVSLSSISINTVPGYPQTLQATIRLNDFEYRQFMPEILPPNIDNKEDLTTNLFSQCIHFPVLRYYYQRALQNGEAASLLEYNSPEYLEATLGQKTVLQPMKFASPLIDFYIANEEFLKQRKQLKDALEKKPFETVVTYTDKEKALLVEVAKMNSAVQVALNNAKDAVKDANSLDKEMIYVPRNLEVFDLPFSDIHTNPGLGLQTSSLLPQAFHDKYMKDVATQLKTFWKDNNTFDHSIVKNYNIVTREAQVSGNKDVKVLWALKIIIDWNRGSSDLLRKLKQDYGKAFQCKTEMLLVDEAISVGFSSEFVLEDYSAMQGNVRLKMSQPFKMVQADINNTTAIDYTNADTNVLAKLANDFSIITNEDGTAANDDIDGDDLFSQNQALANTKDSIDLETPTSMVFDPYYIQNCIVENVAVVYSNNFNKMSLNSMHGYVSQYIGASDTVIEINLKTRDEATVNSLQTLPRICVDRLINYRKIMTCSPLRIDCEVARLAGINEVIIESIDVNTVPGFPGLYQISLRLTSVDRTLRNREALKKLDELDNSKTTNDNQTMTKNYFQLKDALARVELYPDLELPLISDLEKLGYYFIRYKNQKGRLFPDADFYFVYLHAYSSEMLRESILSFFNDKKNDNLTHRISGDLLGDEKNVNINLTAKHGENPITSNDSDNENDEKMKKLYENVDNAFKGTDVLPTKEANSKISADAEINIRKDKCLLDLQESLAASSYATYDFNHKIKLSIKDNTPFNESDKDIFKGKAKVVYSDGTHGDYDSENIVDQINISLKHLIKNILKKPIETTGKGKILPDNCKELIEYLIKDVLSSDATIFQTDVKTGETKTFDSDSSITADNTTETISNNLYNFIGNELRVALGSAMTGTSAVVDFDKKEKVNRISDWFGKSTIQVIEKDGTKKTSKNVKNVIKVVDGQDVSNYVLVDGDDDIYNGIVFGPYAIKKYDANYLGMLYQSVFTNSDNGFIDPYYNKDAWNAFFADEIEEKSVDRLDDDADRVKNYIDIISAEEWDDKEAISNAHGSTIAMFRILLVWFYRLLNDKNNSFLPSAFFYLNKVSETLKEYEDKTTGYEKFKDTMFASDSLWKYIYGSGEYINGKFATIFDKDNWYRQSVERDKEESEEYDKSTEQFKQMKEDLKNGLAVAKINLVCGLFTSLGALAVGEFNTPVFPAMCAGNMTDLSNYFEKIKASYLNASSLNETDLKMRRYLSYLDYDEYNNKNVWNKNVDPLKKYTTQSLAQRKYLAAADIPKIYLMHSFYDMVMHDMRGRMARAFPTYYMLLIDEGRELGVWRLQDNFYDVSSISEFQVVKSRKIAADTASIMMTNMFGTFTSEDEDMKDEYQYTFKDAWNSIFSPREYYVTEYQRRKDARDFNRAKIKPGARVHLRMGYEADASRIPIIFNGAVAEVATQDDMINIVCQGDGVELANPDMFNAADGDDVGDLKFSDDVLGFIYGLFNEQTTPRDLLVNPLTSSGTWIKALIKEWSNSRFFNDNPFGIVHFGDKYYKEVFLNNGEMEQNIYEALNKPSWGSSGKSSFNESLWAMETSPKIRVGIKNKKSYWDLMNIAASVAPEYIAAIAPFQLRSTIFYGAPRYYYAYDYDKTTDGKVVERRKPYQQYHIYTSFSDIIGNKIAASDKDIRTCAVGTYTGDGILTAKTKTVGPMWLDIDIYPEYQKMTNIDCDFTHRSFNLPFTVPVAGEVTELFSEDAYKVAWRATANGLRNTVKDMYTGELIVMGDPSVKPYDKMYVYDTYQDMQGTFDVEAVVHTFSIETGFTTSISPDCVVAVDDKYEKVVHNSIIAAIRPALISTATTVFLSQKFANITRSMFFTAAQAVKSGAQYAENIVNGIKTVAGAEELSQYSAAAEKVLGTLAPAFDATAEDLLIYSTINDLEKVFKSIPSSHDFTSASDLLNFLSDIKKQSANIEKLNPSKLLEQLKAAKESSKFKSEKYKSIIDDAIKKAEEYVIAYTKATEELGSLTIDSKYINAIIDAVPAEKRTEEAIKKSLDYLEKIKGNPLVAGSKNFDEAISNLAVAASTIDDFGDSSKIAPILKELDKTIFGAASKELESFANLDTAFKEANMIKKGASAIKATIASNLLWLAAQIILTKYVQEYLERKLKNLQVLTVFPVMKNNLVMTAGLMGNKGSVFDSPTYNEPGFIEDMAISFFDGKYGSIYPLIMECLVDTTNMKEIVNNYKRDSSYGYQTTGSTEVARDIASDSLLGAVVRDEVKGINSYREIFLVPRVSNLKDDEGKVAFTRDRFVDIAEPETNSRIDRELVYIFDDPYLNNLNTPKDADRQVLLFAAQQETPETTDESGNKISTCDLTIKSSTEGTGSDVQIRCKKIEQPEGKLAIYDIPMLRSEAREVLKRVVQNVVDTLQPDANTVNSSLQKLHEHNIIIHNCTRINEKTSWFCTGYSFTIQVKGWDEFGNILKKMCDDQPLSNDSNGNPYKAVDYKESDKIGDNCYIVMVAPRA